MKYTEKRIIELNKKLISENKKIKKLNISNALSLFAFAGGIACSLALSAIIPAFVVGTCGLIVTKCFFNASHEIKENIRSIENSLSLLTKKHRDELVEEKFYIERKQNKINYEVQILSNEQETTLENNI